MHRQGRRRGRREKREKTGRTDLRAPRNVFVMTVSGKQTRALLLIHVINVRFHHFKLPA